METVEMDLMQAQIAELTTEVTQNSRDIAELKKNTAADNTVTTWSGTLDQLKLGFIELALDHYGEDTEAVLDVFITDLIDGNVSGSIYLDGTSLNLGTHENPIFGIKSSELEGIYMQGVTSNADISIWASYDLSIAYEGSSNYLYVQQGSTVMNVWSMAANAPVEITLRWHKMPNE